MSALQTFVLPERLEAHEPPEARGLERDEVRMLVTERASGRVRDLRARDLPDVLAPGDLLVVNTSATVPAAFRARRADGTELDLHVSTPLPDSDHRLVELRHDGASFRAGRAGERLAVPRHHQPDRVAREPARLRRLSCLERRRQREGERPAHAAVPASARAP